MSMEFQFSVNFASVNVYEFSMGVYIEMSLILRGFFLCIGCPSLKYTIEISYYLD